MHTAPSRVSARTALAYACMIGGAIAYACMIGGAVAAFAWVCHVGAGLPAATTAAPPSAGPAPAPRPDLLPRLLLALLAVIGTARVMAALFQRLHQPPVIGEVIAGIVLGPSLLGRLAPEVAAFVFPAAVVPHIGMLSQVGVILFMFLVGVHLDTGLLGQRRHAVVAISHASIVAPFVLGAALALLLYPRLSRGDVPFATFALFVGVAMSITAFPVLARILRDRGIQNTPIGVLAISCAAVDDVTAWCLLALLIAVARQQAGAFLLTAALVVAYVVLMLAVIRPALRRLVAEVERSDAARPRAVATLLVGVVASALATEAIGIHALFGAFLLGALVPSDSKLAQELAGRIEDVVVVLLLPAFFAVTGLRTELGLLRSGEDWYLCLAIFVVACLGKIGGAMAAARATGLAWRDSAALGALMNTRGLMELIVLNVGLDLGLISPTLFTMMVFMAVFTTLGTAPLLSALKIGTARPPLTAAGPRA